MAFYAAAARMNMSRELSFPCERYDRAGIYRSSVQEGFRFAIHCNFAGLGIKGYDTYNRKKPFWTRAALVIVAKLSGIFG